MAKRCKLSVKRDTPAQRALAEAGWLPYLHVDREIIQRDVAIGAVRLAADAAIAAEFARYADRDALCCPSSRVTVRYRIDRTGPKAVVVPVGVQVTRP